MGTLLGHVMREHDGEDIFDKVEDMRSMAKRFREAGAGRQPSTIQEAEQAFGELAEYASKLLTKSYSW